MAGGEVEVSACRIYAGLRRSMEMVVAAPMNLDGIGLFVPLEDFVWANIGNLEGSPEGALP
jgi:hypothetical protein